MPRNQHLQTTWNATLPVQDCAANILDSRLFLAAKWIILVLLSYMQVLKGRIVFLVKDKYKLAIQVKGLKEKETLMNRVLKGDKKVTFCTGLPN